MIRTRFAPSPTGNLHIGGLRTALFSWLYARKHQGQFMLRIEDTDKARSTQTALTNILDGLAWLGLDYDDELIYQSQRTQRYHQIIQQLIEQDHAYYCHCSRNRLEQIKTEAMKRGEKPRYDGHCRNGVSTDKTTENPVIRFKNPLDGAVLVHDHVMAEVCYANEELDDLIIQRADGSPTYHLTVVVDDMDMKISHVIRGDDHLNNTPRQINILHALSATPPQYAHIPMILDEQGKKLSKRTGAMSVLDYQTAGFLPHTLLNYLVRLGWSHGDQEIFSREEMIQLFDIDDLNKSAASINSKKLLWLNQHYIKTSDSQTLSPALQDRLKDCHVKITAEPNLTDLIEVQKQRCDTLQNMAEQSIYFYQDFEQFDEQVASKHLKPNLLAPLSELYDALSQLHDWSKHTIKQQLDQIVATHELKFGKLAQPIRLMVTGGTISPPLDDTLALLGKPRTLSRLANGIKWIKTHTNDE